ncbi:MAG: hypothetical protein II656_01860 [Ruminococcus sp.]|nr:hypothetical protein [Ruminococcus sp.]
MKKLISLSAALMLGICAFASCGKDDSSSESSESSKGSNLTGKWEVTKYVMDDKEETTLSKGVPIAVGLQFELKEDGKAIGWNPVDNVEEEMVAKWTVDGDKLTLSEYVEEDEDKDSDSESEDKEDSTEAATEEDENKEDSTEATTEEDADMVLEIKDGKLCYNEESDGHKLYFELSKVDSYTVVDFEKLYGSDSEDEEDEDAEITTEAESTEAE